MAFSQITKDQAYARSGGRCECRRKSHNHLFDRCATPLTRNSGEYHHITAVSVGGSDALSNCEYLCQSCHKRTDSYGRS
jgi:5-methylcytosine-specific restriction endonuclease McrA